MKAFVQFLALLAVTLAIPLLGWGAIVVLALFGGGGDHGALHELEAVAAIGLGAVTLAAAGAALAAAECIGQRRQEPPPPKR